MAIGWPEKPSRTTTGGMLLAYVRWLDGQGLTDQVVGELTPEAAALVRDPPIVTALLDARLTDELLAAVSRHRGADAVRQLGYDSARHAFHPVLRPLIDSTMAIYGKTPGAILGRLQWIAGPMISGATIGFGATEPFSGVVEIRYEEPPAPAVFPLWEGVLRALCETCGRQVRVDPSQLADAGRTGRIRVTWA